MKTQTRHATGAILVTLVALLTATSCQVLICKGPNGERFTCGSLGAKTTISSLTIEVNTNGLRRLELRGYTNDNTQARNPVTKAALRAASQTFNH